MKSLYLIFMAFGALVMIFGSSTSDFGIAGIGLAGLLFNGFMFLESENNY